MPEICACGCGRWVKKGHRWAKGHEAEADAVPAPAAAAPVAPEPVVEAALAPAPVVPPPAPDPTPAPPVARQGPYDPTRYPPPPGGRFFKTGL